VHGARVRVLLQSGRVIFLEAQSRWLLIVHLVLAGALVATTTHLVVWAWGFWRGRYKRLRGIRLFAWINAILFTANFALGLLIYPTYKVRVKVEYLHNPSAVIADREARILGHARIGGDVPEAGEHYGAVDLEQAYAIGQWFDVKEHWIAFGWIVSLALLPILRTWHPPRDGDAIARPVLGMALFAAAMTWSVSIIGALTTAYRAVGPL